MDCVVEDSISCRSRNKFGAHVYVEFRDNMILQ